jgi:hypothetical protein
MNDREFVSAVERCAIPCTDFHHADHVRLAWIYLGEHSLLAAIERFTRALRGFATHCGAAGKYHETITWAYLLLIHERMQRQDSGGDWDAFCATNRDLFDWKPSVLELYYAPETLRSEFARRVFVLPDLGASAPTSREELQAEMLRQGK